MTTPKLTLTLATCVALAATATTAVASGGSPASGAGGRFSKPLRASSAKHPRPGAAGRRMFGDQKVEPDLISEPAGMARAFRFHNSVNGTTTSLAVFVGAGSSARRISVALYAGTEGYPSVRLATGAGRSLRRGRWNVVTINPATVRAGRAYWIAVLGSGGRLNLRGRAGSCGADRWQPHMTSLPAKWKKGRAGHGCRMSIYARRRGGHAGAGSGAGTPGTSGTPGSTTTSPGTGAPLLTTGCSPRAGLTMTNIVSHLCGFADDTNTGVPVGTTLYRVPQDAAGPTPQTGYGWSYQSGTIVVAAGGLVTNVALSGNVSIQGAGATVQDSDITDSGAGSYAIELRHASNATIVNNNLHGTGVASPSGCDSAVRDLYADSDSLTVKNNNVWYCADPMNNIAGGGLIEQNYFHDFGSSTPDNHFEDIQMEPGDGQPMTIRDNTFLNENGQTAAIILSNDGGGTETNRTITHNLLGGGGYCFYAAGGTSSPSTNITFTKNSFSRIYYQGCGQWGTSTFWTSGTGAWSGNIWDDSGASVPPA